MRDGLIMKKVHSSSFDPVPIVEAEEMERQHQLKQREFLVRSYGLIEQVCRFYFYRDWKGLDHSRPSTSPYYLKSRRN